MVTRTETVSVVIPVPREYRDLPEGDPVLVAKVAEGYRDLIDGERLLAPAPATVRWTWERLGEDGMRQVSMNDPGLMECLHPWDWRVTAEVTVEDLPEPAAV